MRSLVLAFTSAVSALIATSISSVALAQPVVPLGSDGSTAGPTITYRRAPSPPSSAWDRLGLLGLEVQLRGGFTYAGGESPVLAPNLYPGSQGSDPTGDILRGTEKPYSFDPLAGTILAGYRFLPYLSAGAWFSYASYQVQDGTDTGDYKDGTSQLQRTVWQLGAYGRYYFTTLHQRLQPWVELGVGYSNDTSSYVRGGAVQGTSGQSVVQDYYLTHRGIAVPLTVGLDWRLAPVFSVGPAFGYTRIFPISGCVDSEPQSDPTHTTTLQPVNTCSSPPVEANGYGVFFGGAFIKVTIDEKWLAPHRGQAAPQ
jgi:hypothetical protein